MQIVSVGFFAARFGGTHQYLQGIVTALRQRCWDVAIIVNAEESINEYVDQLAQFGCSIYRLDISKGPRVTAAQEIDSILREVKPDLVHFNSSAGLVVDAAIHVKSLEKHRYPSCFTMHAPLFEPFENGVSILQRLPPRYHWRQNRKKRRFVSLFDQIISVSQTHLDSLHANVKSANGVWIPNGVDLRMFDSAHRIGQCQRDSDVVIGACGSLVRVKRLDILIRAIERLRREYNIKLKIAGDGSEMTSLRELATSCGVDAYVEFCGHQSDVPTFLSSLDIFVMTSDSEAMPYAQLEAMASGLPSVVTGVGDLPTIVRDGVDGFVVPRRNVDDVVGAIEKLLASSELRRQMGENARKRMGQEYSQENCINRTIQIFHRLVNTTG